MRPLVEIKILDPSLGKDVELPTFATENSAGIDIRSLESFQLSPGEQKSIFSGFAIWIRDPAYAAVIAPRSGLGSKGLVVGNTVGLIDADYQGEIQVVLLNRSLSEVFNISRGDRVAQMFFPLVAQPHFNVVQEFSNFTARGEGGFGHTGA